MKHFVKIFEEFTEEDPLLVQIKALPQIKELKKWGFEFEFEPHFGYVAGERPLYYIITGHLPSYAVQLKTNINKQDIYLTLKVTWNEVSYKEGAGAIHSSYAANFWIPPKNETYL